MQQRHGFGTRSVHAGEAPDPTTGAFGVPVYQNTTYAFRSFDDLEAFREGRSPHFVYTRDSNPTVRCLEVKIADLEGAEAAVAGASGMAVISATLLHLVPHGAHLVASQDLYPVTQSFLCDSLTAHGATVTFVDCGDAAAVAAAIGPATRAIFTESFSNPTLRVADLPGLAALARERNLPLVVDNTFLSPALLRPIEVGATIVLHSATKYLGGHGNVLAGVACGPRATIGAIARTLSQHGGALSPFGAWVLLNGVKTLPLRMAQHCANAAQLAALLAAHPAVARVHYPGLPGDPGHALASRLVGERCGGMIAFRLHGGLAATRAFLNALELCTIAVSLGDCGTLIWPFEESGLAEREGVGPLLRLSVGIEDTADLVGDIAGALAVAGGA
jgi:methionine-gamma-lyase